VKRDLNAVSAAAFDTIQREFSEKQLSYVVGFQLLELFLQLR
jgi:hypothetical protein